MSLKTTVQNLQNRAEDAKLSQADRGEFVRNWRRDVADLDGRIRAALLQVIDADVVEFEVEQVTVFEEELGEYPIDAVTVTIVDQIIRIEPVARMTVGGTGRVDLYRRDRPSEDSRVFVVRGTVEAAYAPDGWLIERKRSKSVEEIAARYVVRGYRTYVPLTPDSIQEAVDFLLTLA